MRRRSMDILPARNCSSPLRRCCTTKREHRTNGQCWSAIEFDERVLFAGRLRTRRVGAVSSLVHGCPDATSRSRQVPVAGCDDRAVTRAASRFVADAVSLREVRNLETLYLDHLFRLVK